MEELYPLIPLLPLFGFIINGLAGRFFPRWLVNTVALGTVAGSFLLSCHAFITGFQSRGIKLFTWFKIADIQADFSLLFDPLSVIMIVMVTGVGLIIHIYSCGYMAHDPGYVRFFSYMNLFMFAMLILVLADNFILMFVGWEGVGLCSYLLIGYYYQKKTAANAGMKAFIVNRIGDFGFLIGLFLLFATFRTLNFSTLSYLVADLPAETTGGIITTATLLLFIGAIGKSAQLPLYVWLPDAMEGPSPVSALIHAATMVTAGVYMIARVSFLYVLAPSTMLIVAIVGALTALFAATIGTTQFDIKRILAYSTISQLGYMFLAVGIGAFAAGIFHLLTHAFFKALLFLGAGSVMHAMDGELDIRKMGALKKYLRITQPTMFIASLAITGIPPLSGFFSKDEILFNTFISNINLSKVLWIVGILTAGLTAFYMFRLMFMTFWGDFRGDKKAESHLHEAPKVMAVPLIVLAIGAVFAGIMGIPHFLGGGNWIHDYLNPIFASRVNSDIHVSISTEWILVTVSVICALLGIAIAIKLYKSGDFAFAKKISEKLGVIYKLLFNKYWVDQIYSALIVKPVYWVSDNILRAKIDEGLIDNLLVNGSAKFIRKTGGFFGRLQNGYLQTYLVFFVIGLLILIWLLF